MDPLALESPLIERLQQLALTGKPGIGHNQQIRSLLGWRVTRSGVLLALTLCCSMTSSSTSSNLKKRHRIVKLFADPYQAMSMIQSLQKKISAAAAQEFPQTVANTTAMGESLYSLIKGKNLLAYPGQRHPLAHP
jgi:ABC-type glutathione transport system ATPase component